MAYDEQLAARIHKALARRKSIEEKKMFGGVGFLLNGNMCVGVWKDSLIVRLDQETAENGLLEAHVRPFDITGRPMKGWLLIEPAGIADEHGLQRWVRAALRYVGKLPAK